MFRMMIVMMLLGCQTLMAEENLPIIDLKEIVITATRYPMILKDVPASVTVITKKDIEKTNAKKLGDVLRKTAGVDITSYGAVGSLTQANIRGALAAQVLILVDGRPINSISSGEANLSDISIENIEKIEVMRGPASALYGANAVGGVINVITKKIPAKMDTTLSASYGTYDTLSYKLKNGAKFNDFGYLFNVNKLKSNGLRANSDYDSVDLNGKFEYGDEHKLTVIGGYYQNDLGTPGPKPAELLSNRTATQKKFGNDEVSSLTDKQKEKKGYIDTTVKIKLDETSELLPKFYFESNRLDAHQEYVSVSKTYQGDDIYNTNVLGSDVQYNNFSIKNHNLIFGVNYRQENFDAEKSTYNATNQISSVANWVPKATTKAVFGEDEIKLFESFNINPGLRLDNHSVYGNQINPRLSMLYNLDNINLRVSAGRAFRSPTMNDLYWPETASDKGNPDLKPETAWAYEFNIETWFGDIFWGRIGLFQKDIKDMIAWAPTGPIGAYGPKWQPSNVNSLISRGLELEFKTQLAKEISFNLTYTYINANQKNAEIIDASNNTMLEIERVAANTPQNHINLGLNYETDFDLMVNLSGGYVGKRYRYYSNYSNYPVVSMDTKELPDYFVSDFKITQLLAKSINLFVGVDNIFDIKYKERLGSSITDSDYPVPGRAFTVGTSVHF
ncbi:MAG: TonB-dependent receptor [Candidatus Firestonebacteria bacterium]